MQSAVMAVQEAHQVSLDLSQIMDVVTLYKCKFCDFSCGQPQGIGEHVQQTHSISQLKPPQGKQEEAREIMEMDTSESAGGDGGKLQMGEVSNMTFEAGTQVEDSAESSSLLHSHDVDTSLPHSMLDDTQDVNSDIDAVDRIIEAANVDSGLDVGDDNNQTSHSIAFNKEIYLCGQCNLGFDSMENCKNHMIRDHNVSVEQEPTVTEVAPTGHPPTEVSLPANRVSVGTQVSTSKKPGRKRKIKVEPKPQMSVEEEYEEEMAKQERVREAREALAKERAEARSKGEAQDGEDSGEFPGVVDQGSDSVEQQEECGAGRRRRRLPVRLASLYYMGNRSPSHTTSTSSTTRQQPPRVRLKVEPHKLRCLKAGCNAKFRTQSSLDLHMACHTTVEEWGGRRDVFSCPRCDAADPLWKVLRMHLWKVHLVDTDLYSCEKCGFKVDSVFRLERHMQIHSDQRPYVCDVCEKGFKQASQLQNHKAVHADRAEPNKWYSNKVCEICKRTFANQKSLKIHIESIHSKERPFVCPYCNHATSRKAILDLHVRTHTGEKPFKCDMCTYVTGDHNSLRRHKMRHTGEKPYKCRYCPYSAIQAISLKTHMKNKHPGYEGIFACNLCQYQTVNEQYYNQHVIDHDNGLVPTVRSAPQVGDKAVAAAVPVQGVVVRPARVGQSLIRPALSPQQQQQQTEVQPRLITLQDGRQALAIHAPNIATGANIVTQRQSAAPTAIINQADLAKLSSMGVLQDGTDAAQLIYTALNALSQNQTGANQNGAQLQTGQQVLLSGAQPTVQSTTHEGVTTHTITFHIPPTEEPESAGGQPEDETVSTTTTTTTTMDQQQMVEEQGQLVQVEDQAPAHLVQVEDQASAQLVQVEEDGQIVYHVQQSVAGGGGPQHIIVNQTGEVTYSTEVVPEHTGEPEEEITHHIEDTGQAVDALSEQLVLEISPSETLTETIEVSAYEATPTEATHTETVVVDGATSDNAEHQTTSEDMSTMVANAIEIMPSVSSGEVATMVMEVMDEDGNIQETQVEYVTCAIGEEN